MKKFILLLIFYIFILSPSIATEQNLIYGQINFDWLTKSQLERDENIESIRRTLYSQDVLQKIAKKEFRETYKDYLKDKKLNILNLFNDRQPRIIYKVEKKDD